MKKRTEEVEQERVRLQREVQETSKQKHNIETIIIQMKCRIAEIEQRILRIIQMVEGREYCGVILPAMEPIDILEDALRASEMLYKPMEEQDELVADIGEPVEEPNN